MKRRLIRFFILTFFIYWFLYSCTLILIRTLFNKELVLVDIISSGFLNSIIIIGIMSFGFYQVLKPKFRFLESSQVDLPSFSNMIVGHYDHVNIPYSELKAKIAQNWIVTHTEDNQKVIKFCERIHYYDWGYGGFIAYDHINQRVNCALFPFTRKRLKTKFIEEVNSLFGESLKIENKN